MTDGELTVVCEGVSLAVTDLGGDGLPLLLFPGVELRFDGRTSWCCGSTSEVSGAPSTGGQRRIRLRRGDQSRLAEPMSDTIALRPLTVDDASVMVDVLSSPHLYTFMGGKAPTNAELVRQYGVQTRGQSIDGTEIWINLLVLLGEEREPIGYVQATVPTDGGPAEIAWVIGHPWQGRGYATRAARLLLEVLRECGVARVVADVHPGHQASRRVAARLGMIPTTHVVDGEIRWSGTIR